MSSFVGRTRDLAEIRSTFEEAHVVSLVGVGGIGKSTIAEAACAANGNLDGASFWVDLSRAATEGDLCNATAQALGIRLADGGGADVERVGAALSFVGPALCVLDNFETVLDHAPVLASWSRAAPRVRFLVTTQARLRIREERCLDVGPLDPEAATALFVDTARSVVPGYAPDGAELDAIASLVERVERIPLAVVLLGARRDLIDLREMERHLGLWGLPSSPFRDAPERHTTMAAALESSWRLLPASDQDNLTSLAVLEDTFDLGLAAAALETDDARALQAIARLRDRSMVVSRGAGRFGMLRFVADFASARLDRRGDRSRVEARHAQAVLARAGAAVARLGGQEEARGFAELVPLAPHLHALVRRALAAGDAATAHRAIACLDEVLVRTGPLGDHLEALRAVRTCPGAEALDPTLRARISLGVGRSLRFLGRATEAVPDLVEAADLARGAGLKPMAALAGGNAAYSALLAGRPAEGVTLARRALEDAGPSPRLAGIANGVLGLALTELGEGERGIPHLREGARLLAAAGDQRLLGVAETYLGSALHVMEQWEEAEAAYLHGLAAVRAGEDRLYEVIALNLLGSLQQERGQLQAASATFGEAAHMADRLGALHEWALAVAGTAAVAAMASERSRAAECLARLDGRRGLFAPPRAERLIALQRAHLVVAEAYEWKVRGEPARAEVAMASLEGMWPGSDASIAARVARRTLDKAAGRVASASAGLVLDRRSAVARLPDGTRLDLNRHRNMRSILACLVDARLERPGAPLGVEELQAATWPGMRLTRESASTRVYTEINKLRRRGMEAILFTRHQGYLLDPDVPCLWVDDG